MQNVYRVSMAGRPGERTFGFTAKTEQLIELKIVSAVLPMMYPGMPLRPTVPMIINSAPKLLVKSGITYLAMPLITLRREIEFWSIIVSFGLAWHVVWHVVWYSLVEPGIDLYVSWYAVWYSLV